MNKTLRRSAGVLTSLASLAILAGCAAPLSSGTVIAKGFEEAHSYTEMQCMEKGYKYGYGFGYDPMTGKQSYGYRNIYQCIREEEVTVNVPDRWTVSVGDEESRTATFQVDQSTYDSAQRGYFYDSETGELTAR